MNFVRSTFRGIGTVAHYVVTKPLEYVSRAILHTILFREFNGDICNYTGCPICQVVDFNKDEYEEEVRNEICEENTIKNITRMKFGIGMTEVVTKITESKKENIPDFDISEDASFSDVAIEKKEEILSTVCEKQYPHIFENNVCTFEFEFKNFHDFYIPDNSNIYERLQSELSKFFGMKKSEIEIKATIWESRDKISIHGTLRNAQYQKIKRELFNLKQFTQAEIHNILCCKKFSISDFDQRGNKTFDVEKTRYSGPSGIQKPYTSPLGYERYGLKVVDDNDTQKNSWLKQDGNKDSWYIAYHGTKFAHTIMDSKDGTSNEKNRDAMHEIYKLGFKSSDGEQEIYCSPNFAEIDEYIAELHGFKFALQVCVHPKKYSIAEDNDNYWKVKENEFIKPFGILVQQKFHDRNKGNRCLCLKCPVCNRYEIDESKHFNIVRKILAHERYKGIRKICLYKGIIKKNYRTINPVVVNPKDYRELYFSGSENWQEIVKCIWEEKCSFLMHSNFIPTFLYFKFEFKNLDYCDIRTGSNVYEKVQEAIEKYLEIGTGCIHIECIQYKNKDFMIYGNIPECNIEIAMQIAKHPSFITGKIGEVHRCEGLDDNKATFRQNLNKIPRNFIQFSLDTKDYDQISFQKVYILELIDFQFKDQDKEIFCTSDIKEITKHFSRFDCYNFLVKAHVHRENLKALYDHSNIWRIRNNQSIIPYEIVVFRDIRLDYSREQNILNLIQGNSNVNRPMKFGDASDLRAQEHSIVVFKLHDKNFDIFFLHDECSIQEGLSNLLMKYLLLDKDNLTITSIEYDKEFLIHCCFQDFSLTTWWTAIESTDLEVFDIYRSYFLI